MSNFSYADRKTSKITYKLSSVIVAANSRRKNYQLSRSGIFTVLISSFVLILSLYNSDTTHLILLKIVVQN